MGHNMISQERAALVEVGDRINLPSPSIISLVQLSVRRVSAQLCMRNTSNAPHKSLRLCLQKSSRTTAE